MNPHDDMAASQQLAEEVRAQGVYLAVRVLPDGSVAALMELMYTRSILLGVSLWSWERRFCFADRSLANRRFYALQSEDDEPEGWVARRPEKPEDIEAKSRPGYVGGKP